MRTNCTAFYKIVENKRLNMLRLLVTFDGSKRDKNGRVIITARNSAYASGDIIDARYPDAEVIQLALAKEIGVAKMQLRTENFVKA